MKLEIRKSFEKEIEKIVDQILAQKLSLLIEILENCQSLAEVPNVKKMKAPGNYFRIRIGQYRLGLKNEKTSLVLIRFLHRKDIYTFFP